MPKVQPRITNLYLGIDPGQSGGIAYLIDSGAIDFSPMPTTEQDIWKIINRNKPNHPTIKVFAMIEKVHAMPGQGVTSMFTFGKGYGGLRMALIAAQVPFEEVDPRRWQKGLSIPPRNKKGGEEKADFKKRLRAKAQQLFPKENITLKTCDAILIAEYCRRVRTGTL